MKILFGIQGTGNGHISRARVLANYLSQYPLEMTYLISGRNKDKLFDMEVFGDFIHKPGLTFITENGQLSYWKTLRKNNLITLYQDIKRLDVSQYDLIISDFEPITAWTGKLKGVPTLGIGHQYAFGKNTPLAGDNWLSRLIMQYFAPTSESIGLHWYPYDDTILPPIIDTSITKDLSKTSRHILVYLPFENARRICQILKQITSYQFIVYSPDVDDEVIKNVCLKKTAYKTFKHDLVTAEAVICNSGFELISECLHLGLPILTKPLKGQMEQHSNAQALTELKLAEVINKVTVDSIKSWLKNKKEPEVRQLPDVAKIIAEYIASGQWQNIQEQKQLLWQYNAI